MRNAIAQGSEVRGKANILTNHSLEFMTGKSTHCTIFRMQKVSGVAIHIYVI